jgi:serine/threonine-protein kinase
VTLVAATGSVSTGVPNVVGLAVDQAFVRLQAAGFKGNTVKVASRRAPNTVVSQTPVAGTQAAKGSLVVLKISKVGGQATVPRVVGESEPIATAKLGAAGFKVRVERVASPQPKGRIVTQDPAPGTSAARGSVVGLQVSDGPQAPPPGASGPKVPRVIGMGQAAAFTRIEQAGFRADSFPVASSRTRGLVIRQRPQAGTRAQPKSVVRLAVSLGSGARPLRVVPDVRGMTETNAKRVLVRVGFTVRAVRPPNASPSSGGVVSTQRPGAGVRVRAGSQVAIYLGPPQAQ